MCYKSDMGIKGAERGNGPVKLPIRRLAEILERPYGTVQRQLNRKGIRGGKDHLPRLRWLISELQRRKCDGCLAEAINERREWDPLVLLEGTFSAEGPGVGFDGGEG